MLPMVSGALTMARVLQGLPIPQVAVIAGVDPAEVFDAENFLEDVHPITVQLTAVALGVDLSVLS